MTHRALLELLDSINFPPFFAFEVVVFLVEVPELEEALVLLVIQVGANTSADGSGIVIPTLYLLVYKKYRSVDK